MMHTQYRQDADTQYNTYTAVIHTYRCATINKKKTVQVTVQPIPVI